MKTYIPSYYSKFKCIADKCTHNCCIGWEIGIDPDTFEKYKLFDSKLGTTLLENIEESGDGVTFRFGENKRCANLDGNNLCKIISAHGEDALCDICREHPRFRNYFDGREELGLGLSCEEAARIILSNPDKVTMEFIEEDTSITSSDVSVEATALLSERDALIAALQDRSLSVSERIEQVLTSFDTDIFPTELDFWCDVLLGLERLDESWTDILSTLKNSGIKNLKDVSLSENELAAEQLLVYFVTRHLQFNDNEPDDSEQFNVSDVFKFAILSCYVIFAAANLIRNSFDNFFDALCEAARLYSSEIEYSTDNTDELLFEVSF